MKVFFFIISVCVCVCLFVWFVYNWYDCCMLCKLCIWFVYVFWMICASFLYDFVCFLRIKILYSILQKSYTTHTPIIQNHQQTMNNIRHKSDKKLIHKSYKYHMKTQKQIIYTSSKNHTQTIHTSYKHNEKHIQNHVHKSYTYLYRSYKNINKP